MSRKVEKKLRQAAKEMHKKILEDDKPFFNELLMPLFEEQKQKMKTERKSRVIILRHWFYATSILVFISVITVLLVFLPQKNGYAGPFTTIPSNIQKVNQCLSKTQLNGEFAAIILSADAKSKKEMFFTVSHEQTSEETMVECNLEVIIERSLSFDFEKIYYKKKLNILGYEVNLNEDTLQSTYEDIPVFEHHIEAYFDTGKERFFIKYYAISINNYSNFKDYLTSIIKNKYKLKE